MDWADFPRESVECMLCGADEPIHLSTQRSWPVSRCGKCGFIYLSQRPVEEALEEMYSKEYYDSAEVGYGGYVENFRKYNDIFTRLFDRRARDLEPFRGSGGLLEVAAPMAFSSTISGKRTGQSPAWRLVHLPPATPRRNWGFR